METNNNSKFNFYTQNGWVGSNYDSKLSTKEIAAKVRAFAKKNFPGFKFSVRSEWSMYTDSMYIELKEGTCIPFVEGSRSAERGYMDTMNTVKGWEKELTPEMFKVLDAVTIYANSFRYDDSDSMQDYFDTNFYLKIKVSDEYKAIEPKAKKSSVNPEKVEKAKEVEAVTVKNIEVVDYSEKAIAIFGDTQKIKDQLKSLGGRFNPSLKHNGVKRAGWIFSKKQTDKVHLLLSEQKETNEPVKRGKSLQDIIDQTRRLNGNAGRNWYWSFKREKLINEIYTTYVANIGKLGAYSEPNKKFSKEEYTGLIRELETEDIAPIEATNKESEISQKKGYYTKEENGYKVESYFTKDKTALEKLIEINDQQSIREMIEAKERAFTEASENTEFYRSIGNDEFADTEQTRANRLKKDLDQLRQALPTEPIKPTGSDTDMNPTEPTKDNRYEQSEGGTPTRQSEGGTPTRQSEGGTPTRQSEGVVDKNKAGDYSGLSALFLFDKFKVGRIIGLIPDNPVKVVMYALRYGNKIAGALELKKINFVLSSISESNSNHPVILTSATIDLSLFEILTTKVC